MYLKNQMKGKLELRGTVDEPNKVMVVAKEEFTKGTLCLVPYSSANFVDKEPTHPKAVAVQFSLRDEVTDFWIPFNGSIIWDKDKSILSPYWAVGFAKEGTDDKANMYLKRVSVKLGTACKVDTPEFNSLQAARGVDRGTFSFPVLVNKMRVKAGDPLWR